MGMLLIPAMIIVLVLAMIASELSKDFKGSNLHRDYEVIPVTIKHSEPKGAPGCFPVMGGVVIGFILGIGIVGLG
jgi:hypothetical protein